MEILGIGAPEFAFIIIIALLVLGPKDMQKAGKTVGKWLRDLVTSDGWKAFQQTSRELRNLPTKLMREANEDLNKVTKDINKSMDVKIPAAKPNQPPRSVSTGQVTPPASPPSPGQPPADEPEHTIQPPAPKQTDTDSDSDQHA